MSLDTTDRPTIDGLDLLAGTWGRHVPHDQFDRPGSRDFAQGPVCAGREHDPRAAR